MILKLVGGPLNGQVKEVTPPWPRSTVTYDTLGGQAVYRVKDDGRTASYDLLIPHGATEEPS